MKIISSYVDRMGVIDDHSRETARLALVYEIAYCSFSAWKELVDKLKQNGYRRENSVFVGPDLGRRSHTSRAAEYLGTDLISLDKEKTEDGEKLQFKPLTPKQIVKIKGKRIIIFDDIIASARTLDKIKELIGEYVESITVIATHASFIENAIGILADPKFERIIITDGREPYKPAPRGGKFEIISSIAPLNRFLRQDMSGQFNPWQDSYFSDTISKV